MSLVKFPALLVLFTLQYVAFALPVSNITSDAIHTPTFPTHSSCNDLYHCRSLVGVVWSCMTMIFLCTWVAAHPNVPDNSRDFIDKMSKTRWGLMILMLVSPEVVVISAVIQWVEACSDVASHASSVLLLFPIFH